MPASPTPTFQIAISGSAGLTYPSVKSTDLGETGFEEFKLANIRHKCNISSKLLFTADGKTSIDDDTTLAYYMSLSAEGQAILQSSGHDAGNAGANVAPGPDPVVNPAVDPQDPVQDLPANPPVNPPPQKATELKPGVPTFIVQVLDSTPGAAAMPDTGNVTKLLEEVSKSKFLERGALPTFAERELTALKADYAAAVSTASYKEPAELTEVEWDAVLKNTRAFHGYYTDIKKGILVKASKPAFRLRPALVPGTPAKGVKEGGASQDKYNPPIPPFYIFDDSSVKVTEINHQLQDTLVKEGFNSLSVSGSLGGGKAIPVSVSAAFDEEHSWANQEKKQTNTDTLAVTYNFPRVVIELDSNCLELTPECTIDAIGASDKEGVERFKRRYGTIFTTCFTLGGFLHSTRNVTKEEQARLDQVKDQTRKAAGISIMTPKLSGSFGVASASGTGKETGQAQLYEEARLTWDAHGGNTLLASNPTVWVGSVKDHRLWRLMDQQRVVDMFSLVKEINLPAYNNLMDPRPDSDVGKDPIKDENFNAKIQVLLMEAILEPSPSTLVTQMEDYYRNNKYDALPANHEFNKFMTLNYPQSHAGVITPGIKYQGLSNAQRVYFGLFMTFKGQLKFN